MMFLDAAPRTGGAYLAPLLDMRPRLEPLYGSHERIVVIRGVHWNLNMRAAYERVYGAPNAGERWRFILHRDALVLSRSEFEPAMVTGHWPGLPFTPLTTRLV